MNESVLIIEDDQDVQRLLVRALERENIKVQVAGDGETGIKLAVSLPDLVVLDINLPGISGLEVCQVLKKDPMKSSVPILVITGDDREGKEIACLELGADDYLAKPFTPALLMAHIRALLRRGPYRGAKDTVLDKDGIQLDVQKKTATVDGKVCSSLTPKEFDLLYHLVMNGAVPLKRDIIYRKVWGTPPVSQSVLRTVDVHVQRIRSKLSIDRKVGLVSVSGRGYMWRGVRP